VRKQGYGFWIMALALGLIFCGTVSKSFSDTEIDLDDTSPAAPTPGNSQEGYSNSAPVPTATPIPMASPLPTTIVKVLWPTATPTEEAGAVDTPIEVHGVLKMKDIYEAGIKAYQDQDYDKAIRYLKKSLETEDPYSPKFYYAEANAMLGVIYQFHIIHFKLAYQYYQAALKYEKNNPTARKHIKQVAQYKDQED
jgi:tetratricopeptide (TPR) repeat protein